MKRNRHTKGLIELLPGKTITNVYYGKDDLGRSTIVVATEQGDLVRLTDKSADTGVIHENPLFIETIWPAK